MVSNQRVNRFTSSSEPFCCIWFKRICWMTSDPVTKSVSPEVMLAKPKFCLALSLFCILQYECKATSCFLQRQMWQAQSRSNISCPAIPKQSEWKHLLQIWQMMFAPLPFKQIEHASFLPLKTESFRSTSCCRIQNLSLLLVTASRFSFAAIAPRKSTAMQRAEMSLHFKPAFSSSKTQRTCKAKILIRS